MAAYSNILGQIQDRGENTDQVAQTLLTLMLHWCLRCRRKGPDWDWAACLLPSGARLGRSLGVWQLLLPPGHLWVGGY